MPSWGTYELFTTGEYSSPFPSLSVEEIGLIPLGTDTPSTSIQTGGRGRKRASMSIFVESSADYQALYLDYLSSTTRVYTGFRSETMNAMISELSPPEYILDGSIQCSITFLEV